MIEDKWNVEAAARLDSELDQLVYRSNLLGSERAVVNWGGGNTSVKTTTRDFKGEEIEIMWVKGSGSDLATIEARQFTGLKLADIRPLIDRDDMTDKEMVDYLSHCMIDSKQPRPSIETLLHAFLPFKNVDHTHPDAIISICCSTNGKKVAEEIYGDRFVWVPYIRPGFKLSKMIAEAVQNHPSAELVLMEKHGLVTWGDTAEESYKKTIQVIREAEAYIEAHVDEKRLFGGAKYTSLDENARKDVLQRILPVVRGAVSDEKKQIVSYDDSEDVLTFVNSHEAPRLSQVGAACPDHLVHTKRVPLYIDWDPASGDVEALVEKVKSGIEQYKAEYKAYFDRNKGPGMQRFEASPRIILIPGVGMINTGKSWAMSKVSAELYHRAIAVMRGATILGDFVSLNESESFNVEYWPLELYKLSLQPPEAEFSRKVGLVTGGAGAIGSETCRLFAEQGMHVVIADLNAEGAQKLAEEINTKYGDGRALAVQIDVTKEEDVRRAYREAVLAYGGVDVVVNNAGLATSSPFEETSMDEWNLNMNVLVTGYFLVAREGYKIMKEQALGGSIIFVGSKNSIYAGKNVTAYSTAKAAEVHLARTIAAEGGKYGIRVNSVLPDAVMQGSGIWNSSWREERAKSYGIAPDELEEYYRKRTTLLVNIYPRDIAEAIAFFASSKAEKTTGCMITVDGGVPGAFTR